MIILRALHAECLKLKGTLALRLAFAAPVLMVLLNWGIYYQRGWSFVYSEEDVWVLFSRETLTFWALLLLPLFVTLEMALLGGLEHNNHQWKHLYALPLPRWVIYFSKQISGMAVIAISMAMMPLLLFLGGQVLRLLRPGMGFEAPAPLWQLIQPSLLVYLSAWMIISIHTWLGLRARSFVTAVGAGIALTVSGAFIINASWGTYYPWALPGIIANTLGKGYLMQQELLFGVLGGIVLAVLGGWHVSQRDVGG